MTLADFPLWFLRGFAIAFGLIWGSFLNVVIYRVPRGLSVVRPGSACPACGKPIRAWDNVPVLGYLLLRGKARRFRGVDGRRVDSCGGERRCGREREQRDRQECALHLAVPWNAAGLRRSSASTSWHAPIVW